MSPITRAPEQGLIDDLPATLEGLWTALAMTQGVAGQLVARQKASISSDLDAMAEACAEAVESVATSRAEPLHATTDMPAPRVLDPAEALSLVSALTSSSIDLAVDLLGNEEEPLTPVEVLAVTRAVTALCAARTLAQAGAA